MHVIKWQEYQALAASLGAKPSGCTETLIITMAPETTLYFIINTTHTTTQPWHEHENEMSMKLKIKMEMKTNKKKGGSFFSTTGTAFPKCRRSSSFSFLQGKYQCRGKKKQTNNRRRGRTKEQNNEEQKTKLFCGPESTRALTNKLLKTLLSQTGNGKGKKIQADVFT